LQTELVCGYDLPMPSVFLIDPGPRPVVSDVAEYLWGAGCDVDSDGNATAANDRSWTELTLTLRPGYRQRIDVDPLDDRQPLVLVIRSETDELAQRIGSFLHSASGGELSDVAPERIGS